MNSERTNNKKWEETGGAIYQVRQFKLYHEYGWGRR